MRNNKTCFWAPEAVFKYKYLIAARKQYEVCVWGGGGGGGGGAGGGGGKYLGRASQEAQHNIELI